MEQPRVFISYSHKDEELKDKFLTCIKSLPPQVTLEVWDDRHLLPGDEFDRAIFDEIACANVFFALISLDYLSSEYCRKEMYEALEKAEDRGCRVVPVIVRETPSWTTFPIGQRNAIPKDGMPLTDWSHPDKFWAEVQRGLMTLFPLESPRTSPDTDRSTAASKEKASIQVVDFACLNESRFLDQAKQELANALRPPVLQDAVQRLCAKAGKPSGDVEQAADFLLKQEPMPAVDLWTSIVRDCMPEPDETGQHHKEMVWKAGEQVHLALLPRLVSKDWLERWSSGSDTGTDRLRFSLKFRDKPPNRSVEVLLSRLDEKRRITFITTDPVSPKGRAVPRGMIHANNEGLLYGANPEPLTAAEKLARHLFVLADEDPPEHMTAEDWEELDALLLRSRAGAISYYIVIPASNSLFGNPAVLNKLRDFLPNLPRIIVGDAISGDQPFNCRPADIEHAITTFHSLKFSDV